MCKLRVVSGTAGDGEKDLNTPTTMILSSILCLELVGWDAWFAVAMPDAI